MKILIAYSTKSGTVRECAEELAKKLSVNQVTTACIDSESPEVEGFDLVIVGGYVRMGKICKNMKSFIEQNADLLEQTMHAFFICCGLPESTDYYFEKAVSKKLLDSSISTMSFGGDLRIDKQKGIDKIIAKMILASIKNNNIAEDMNDEMPVPAVVPENISRFADDIRHSF